MKSLKELDRQELLNITGGESGWYWVMYGIGRVARAIVDSYGVYKHGGTHYHSAG